MVVGNYKMKKMHALFRRLPLHLKVSFSIVTVCIILSFYISALPRTYMPIDARCNSVVGVKYADVGQTFSVPKHKIICM